MRDGIVEALITLPLPALSTVHIQNLDRSTDACKTTLWRKRQHLRIYGRALPHIMDCCALWKSRGDSALVSPRVPHVRHFFFAAPS
jgi:hypothetical protein